MFDLRLELKCCVLSFTAPTSPPLNVKISNTSSTSLNASWDRPPESQTHGIIRQYVIKYQEVKCGSNGTNLTNWVYVPVSGTLLSNEIKNLRKWSCYEVQIRAVTIKTGVWSKTEGHRTSEDGKRVLVSSPGSVKVWLSV